MLRKLFLSYAVLTLLTAVGFVFDVSQHLAQVFSGSVKVKSQVGKGSTFTVPLPLA